MVLGWGGEWLLLKKEGIQIARCLKACATKPHDLNLIPGAHAVEGEDHLLQTVFDIHFHAMHVQSNPQ